MIMATIEVNLERGRKIFENIEEYPLPRKTGRFDYIFYFVPTSKGYGLGASTFFKKYYHNHIEKSAKCLEEIIDILHSEIQSKTIEQIREIVIVSHANIHELLFPVTKNAFTNKENKAKYQIVRAGTLVNLQEAFSADEPDLEDFKTKRKKVIEKFTETSRVTIRACNFGSSRDGLFALYSFFGGRANVYAPHEYQFFLDKLGIGVKSRIKTDLDFYQHLVKQGFISRKTKHSESRRVKIIKKLIEPGRGRHRFELSGYRLENNKVISGDKDEQDALVNAFNQKTIPNSAREKFSQEQLTLSGEETIQVKKKDEKWILFDDKLKIKVKDINNKEEEHTYKIIYTLQVEYEQFSDDQNYQAAIYVYPVLNHRNSLASIPIQLFFSDDQNEEYKGQIFELAKYSTLPEHGVDAEAKENYDAYVKLLDGGDFRNNNGQDIPAFFNQEFFPLTNPKINQLPDSKGKKQWEILDDLKLVIKEVVENFSSSEQLNSLKTEYKGEVIELSSYGIFDDQITDVEEKKVYDAYKKLLNSGKMKDNKGHDIIQTIIGDSPSKNAGIRQLQPENGKDRWEFHCSLLYVIKETFYYLYPKGFITALKVIEPVTRAKRLSFIAMQGSDPDMPGTELMAYLDNHSLEELYDFIHFLRKPYKEEHAFYIYMAQEAMKRKAEFMTWPVKTEIDVKRKTEPLYIYPSWAMLNDTEREHKEKYAYTFSNVWMEVKASSSRNKEFTNDLFEERKLPFPSEIFGEIMEPDTPENEPEILKEDPNNPERTPDPPPDFFDKERVFTEARLEDLSCQKFKEALEIIKENQGKSWEELEKVFRETKVDDSITFYEYMTSDYYFNSINFAIDMLGNFSPYASSSTSIAARLGTLAESRLIFAGSVFFAIAGPAMMLKSVLDEISKGKENYKKFGTITGLKQGKAMIWAIIYKFNNHGTPIADSYDLLSEAPNHIEAYKRFTGDFRVLILMSEFLNAHQEGYDFGLKEVNKALNEDLRKHRRIFKHYVMKKGLKECHFKLLLDSGLIDENRVKRAILLGLYNQLSKVAQYDLINSE